MAKKITNQTNIHSEGGSIYKSFLRPLLFTLPPETAHEVALHSLSFASGSKTLRNYLADKFSTPQFGKLERFGLSFSNPVGLAAGFDKNGVALQGLAALGFGHIEAGTVTYEPQPGNPRPRLFRLPADRALINRAGFNNEGAAAFAKRVSEARPSCVLGVSIGKSRAAADEDTIADYLKCFEIVLPIADYVAVNVSSPNTPGLRDLQKAEQLEALLRALQAQNKIRKPLLVKLAPELSLPDLELIVDVAKRCDVAGIIATNTTVNRDGLQTPETEIAACGAGGLSGAPLRESSTRMIANLYRLCASAMTIVGVGGIFSTADAWEKICAGASLVQLYTGFIYQGPSIAKRINIGLAEMLKQRGFNSLDEAVGSEAEGRKRI